ncbi:spatacsin-like isoform X2 [Stegodyphus dumicola]|uniref:spatacsin-like isoform X2 n=1 Tax=Stegodyphus dumicola TaxID=202533 RepID=UPI0015ABC29D|nr:spatacsin-like isoform X2 [Stegodyphus dumicola]
MALEILLIKELSYKFENVQSVTTTSDSKLLAIHDTNLNLSITLINTHCNHLQIHKVKSFAWQEDNYNENEYRFFIVDIQNNIYYYAVTVTCTENCISSLTKSFSSIWNLENIFSYFQELKKCLADLSSVEILKFEAREAVFLFNKRTVVSFFPSTDGDPQIMSISDLSESSLSHRKVLLMKEMLFALNDSGTKLSVYSFSTNAKIFEYQFSDNTFKFTENEIVQNFTVNLRLDTLIFVTENQQVYSMPLDLSSQTLENSTSQTSSGITAFTKQFPSVRRLDDGLRRFSAFYGSIQPVTFTCDTKDLVLKDFVILENKLFFIYHGVHDFLVGIHILCADEPTVCKSLSHPPYLITSGCEEVPYPVLLLTENKISLLLYDIEQDKLVNELMIYPSDGVVEELALLNNWSNIHMDIEVLKLGLSNRQLYTVEFFLKTLFEGFCQQWNAPLSPKWYEKMQKECNIWDTVLNLVSENVCKNLTESLSCQYAEQLLYVTINMVIQILSVIEQKNADDRTFLKKDKDVLLSKFSGFILNMRKLLREQDSSSTDISENESENSTEQCFSCDILKLWTDWKERPNDEIIKESLLNGTIPLAQAYFSCCCKNDFKSSYQEFEKNCDCFVIDYLRQGQIPEALITMSNMGIDINIKLKDIFKRTPEKDIRMAILKELHMRDLLSNSDSNSLQFILLLEKLYPCTSFDHARVLLDEKQSFYDSDVCCVAPESDATLTVGDFIDFTEDNSENGAYCRIVMNWLSTWDDDVKRRILASHFLKNSPVLDFFMKEENSNIVLNPLSVWYYLLENGILPYLMNWIDTWLGKYPQTSESSLFNKWPLNAEMINAVSRKATFHVSETILNELARHGVFCEEELEDISLFLARIGKAQCNINDIMLFTSEKAAISFSDLCHRLAHYCLKHNLVSFLYSFVSHNYSKFSSWPSCQSCDVPLLYLTKAFFLWSQDHENVLLAYDAIVGTAQYLFNLENPSNTELLMKVPLSLSLAVLLFKSQPLNEVMNDILKRPCAPASYLKEKFQSYPLLCKYLFKTPEERFHPDVTVYELLKGSIIFDTCQLFGWQSANSLKSEDAQTELPHFSLKSLSEQYGLKKDLTYLYYLMEGRPNYAYLKFIAQEVVLETGLSISRVRSTCKDVMDYALLNYRSADICAASISFIELLGQDSLPLRCCLNAANILHENQAFNEEANEKSFPEIGWKFKQAFVNKDSAANLITEIENIFLKKWNPYSTEPRAVFKDTVLWMPVMTLSHLYEVEAGNSYLNECAKQNNWFKFLVFSQIFQIPKEQVLKAVSRFSNSCISYHISHALNRRSALLYDVAYKTKSSTVLKSEERDMRKSLYSRIGVKQGTSPVELKKTPEQDEDKSSIATEETSSSSSDVDLRSFVLKDLFSQLLLAHSSDTPWEYLLHTSFEIKNPALAILAASYHDSPLESCFFMWLYTNLHRNERVKKELDTAFSQIRVTNCSADDVKKLFVVAVQNHKILTLWQGVLFFLSSTPLLPLMDFLRSFMVYKKFDASVELFQNHLWDYPQNRESLSELHSLLWIENTSVCILKEAVIACATNYQRLILLRHFSHTRLEKSFSKEVSVPQFMKVCQMIQCLGSIEDFDVKSFLLPENDVNYKHSCWETLKKLLENHLYDDARTFTTAAKLPVKEMILLQINHESEEARKSSQWNNLTHRIDFWHHILDTLNQNAIPLEATIEFLDNQCEVSDIYGEKYFLIYSMVNILSDANKHSSLPDATVFDLEGLKRKMWWLCLKAEVNKQLLPEIFDVKPVHEFDALDLSFDTKSMFNVHSIENEEERIAIQSIIGQFLRKKDVQNAFQLAKSFNYECQDLKIVKICLEIATSDIDLNAIDISSPDCAPEVSSSRFIRSLLLWINNGYSGITTAHKDKIKLMEKLSRKSIVSVAVCHQILVHYTVSAVLIAKYWVIAKEKNHFKILKDILVKKLYDEHILAKCFIIVHDLADVDVARFLSEEIWHSLKILCPLNINFSITVELCICAHECFTAACDVDGISKILHNSQMLVSLLEEAEKFATMVHLLTGLGRYSEMMYVFDTLKSHDKLSLLFEKNMEDVPNLRLALLDYLKRCSPADSDSLFYAVASGFGMYREKAEILEMSVQKQLSQLCKKNIDADLSDELENALQVLSEAAKSYCKADCLHQAQHCTRLAQLIALQIHFLPSGIWIIGLDDSSISRFITQHDNFSQALIVAEEYRKHQLWAQAVLHNVVLRGDREYLREFQAHFGLSASLISDVAKRFKKVPTKNDSALRNMKLLLSLCSNIKVKYCLANDLSFGDMASELLMGEGSSYLQDLIANNIIK